MEPTNGDVMVPAKFHEKFVAFIDILGFKDMVQDAAAGKGRTLDDILRLVDKLGSSAARAAFERTGPKTCPGSPAIRRDLDFRVTRFSDSVVVSAEVSPAGVVNLVHYCWASVMELLHEGVLCRGYITRGLIYHSDSDCIGPAYQCAVEHEKSVAAFARDIGETGTPFVEIAREIRDYVDSCGDECVRKMFWRNAKEADGKCALFVYNALSAPIVLAGLWARPVAEQREAIRRNRAHLVHVKTLVSANAPPLSSKARAKTEQCNRALDEQFGFCDGTDRLIDALKTRVPKQTIGDLRRSDQAGRSE